VEAVTRQRAATTTDAYGNTQQDWTAPTSATLTARGVEPVSSTEENDNRQTVITGYRLYLDIGSDVLAGDRIVMRGSTYDVDGDPADWQSPWGTNVGGVVVGLTLTKG
jgi:hypothetical protein